MKIKVQKDDVGKRADIFVAQNLPEFSRSSLSGLFDKELVKVDGVAVKPSYKIKANDKLTIDISPLMARPDNIELPVLYEDGDVVVIDKPAGILTHAKGALNAEATVASFIEPRLNDNNLKGNRAGIVHRLDRATSGVIIAAKNEGAMKYLQKQFSTRKVKKTYLAIVEGVPEPEEAIIDAPIERNPKKPQTFRVGGDGRPAQTRYKVLKILNRSSTSNKVNQSKDLALLEIQPLTGRTHQLRVHLRYVGHPIVGDSLYGHSGEHLFLHAKALQLILPGGKPARFEAKEPDYFKELVNA